MHAPYEKLNHPNVHQAFSQWSEDQTLYLACMYSNPQRWEARRRLMNDFRERMKHTPNVKLYVGEVAFGDRPFEVTNPDNPLDVQFRTSHELWLKENVINLVHQRFPHSAQYVGYVDGDVQFARWDWALEAVHQLQHYAVVQLFHQFTDVDYKFRPIAVTNGFAYSYANSITPSIYRDPAAASTRSVKAMDSKPAIAYTKPVCSTATNSAAAKSLWWGATGLGWAFRRSTWNAMGGLYDKCILGSADWVMAYGMVGMADGLSSPHCAPYYRSIKNWQRHALSLQANLWYIDNHLTHYWHGPKNHRFYQERERILHENEFDPETDLKRDWQGLLQLAGNKPQLRDDLRHYFRARNEDDLNLGPEEHLIA